MRLVWQSPDGEQVEWAAVMPWMIEGQLSASGALQRETGMKLPALMEMLKLEIPSMQGTIFFTFWKNGRKITFERAGDLLDEVEWKPDPGDERDESERDVDPTSVPEGSAPADAPDAEDGSPT